MTVTVIAAGDLTDAHERAWRDIQAENESLRHPLLGPEFTRTVATVRDDVYVGVLEAQGRIVGFFPHQRGWLMQGTPVGGPLNTFQAVIAAPQLEWDAATLVASCQLSQWTFTQALAAQPPLEAFHVRRDVSAVIDLATGPEAYLAEKDTAFRSYKLMRRRRKLERTAGRLRCVTDPIDGDGLALLLQWKAARYARQSHDNVFTTAWIRDVLGRLHAVQTPAFSGVLSLLYAGRDIIAAHFGIRSHGLLHSVVFSYNPTFASYSPGLMLFVALAESAADIGVRRIELGGGGYRYKRLLANDGVPVAGGTVDRIPLITAARRWQQYGADRIRGSRLLRPPARLVLRTFRRLRHSLAA
jgi:CelD/BcsL family acetyltransferase involved in cellulose biosynthesis